MVDGFEIGSVLVVGPDGLPVDFGKSSGTGGPGTGDAVNVKVINQAATVVKQIEFDLSIYRDREVIDITPATIVYGVTVRRLSPLPPEIIIVRGPDYRGPRLHLGGPSAPGLEIEQGEAREFLNVSSLALSNHELSGAWLQLEIYGGV